MNYYILDGKTPVECPDVLKWARWFEEIKNRRVAEDYLSAYVKVSTVFLGIDHNFTRIGAPLLFETMVFGGPHDGFQERYRTWDEAQAGHKAAVELASQDSRSQSVTSGAV